MSKILITGANGFIGSHLVEKFIAEGHQVFGLVRKTSDLSLIENMDIQLRYGDVTQPESLTEVCGGIDILVHNAGLASDWGSIELFRSVNVEGTKNIAQAALEKGVKRIVQMSSVAIHGFDNSFAVKEDDALNPVYNYSTSKMEAEHWILDFGKKNNIEVTAIRPGNVFGERDHTFIEKYIEALVSGQIAYVNGGKSMTCPTYVRNLRDAVYLASQNEKAVGEAFLITDGLEINWKDFTNALAEKMNVKKPKLSIPLWLGLPIAGLVETAYKVVGAKSAPLITKYRMYNGGTDYYFSIEKAKSLLGFNPKYDLDESLTNTANWYKAKYNL